MDLIAIYKENKDSARLKNPDWKKDKYGGYYPVGHSTWVHQWERYVPDDLKDVWNTLDNSVKAAIFLVCEPQASNEEWD